MQKEGEWGEANEEKRGIRKNRERGGGEGRERGRKEGVFSTPHYKTLAIGLMGGYHMVF